MLDAKNFIVLKRSEPMELEKLRHLLEHWIKHNESHTLKYREWAEKIRNERGDISRTIEESIEYFEKGNEILKKALEMLR